jgi:hypothetical protein
MELAKKIANTGNTKVIIRLKPTISDPAYENFYEEYVDGESNILLTHFEFELFDFLEVTDVFLTSISTSGYDIAVAGGNVLFVDLINDQEAYYHWNKYSDILLSESDAYDVINKLLHGSDSRKIVKIKSTMEKMRQYLGYNYGTFEKYKENLHKQLFDAGVFSEIILNNNNTTNIKEI